MSDLAIRLNDLDRLAGLLPECTPPRTVAELARAALEIRPEGETLTLTVAFEVDDSKLGEQAAWLIEQALHGPTGRQAMQAEDVVAEPANAEPPATEPAGGPVGTGEWSEDEKRTLERLWADGAEMEAIAAALPGRTPRGIGEMRRRLGLPARAPRKADRAMPAGVPWTADEDAVLMRMWGEGASASAIAAALPGRTGKAVEVRKARLQARSDSAAAERPVTDAEPPAPIDPAVGEALPAEAGPAETPELEPEAAPAAPEVAGARTRPAGLSDGAARIYEALAELDDSFEPVDDRLLVEERFKGAAISGIAEQLDCDDATVTRRWKQIRACKVDNKGGLMTAKGWADLRAAVARRAAEAEA